MIGETYSTYSLVTFITVNGKFICNPFLNMPLLYTVSWHGPIVNRRAKVPEQSGGTFGHFPHHFSTCNGRDDGLNVLVLPIYHKLVERCSCTAIVTGWKYLGSGFNTTKGRKRE